MKRDHQGGQAEFSAAGAEHRGADHSGERRTGTAENVDEQPDGVGVSESRER